MPPDVVSPADADIRAIEDVLDRFRLGFTRVDIDALTGMWDATAADLVYIAQEKTEPILGWCGIEAYYRALPTVIPVERVTAMDVAVRTVSVQGSVALAMATFRFEGETRGSPEPFIADARTTFILRKHAHEWRVIHYHESAPPR